jgi:hypothetical protein
VAEGLPQAHGLAAYLRFSPADGSAPDVETAAKLAEAGALLGDWLSKEILILLYSRDMVPAIPPTRPWPLARDIGAEGRCGGAVLPGLFPAKRHRHRSRRYRSVQWLAQAADAGYVRAQPFLSEMYEQGRAVTADAERAAALLWSALKAGDAVALPG